MLAMFVSIVTYPLKSDLIFHYLKVKKNRFHSSDRFTADIEKERKKTKSDGRGLTTVRVS